jgi:hypothetical protein
MMTSTAILTEDSTTIVAEEENRFRWGIAIAGAIAATATSFFLITLGAGVGLALAPSPNAASTTAFLTLGAIYFFASQAFGFAVGGYLVGRLIGPEVENSKEEEFRAAAHGFVMWAIAVVAGLLVLGAASALGASSAAMASRSEASPSAYWLDVMFRPAQNSPQVTADKAEVARILVADTGRSDAADTERMARLVAEDTGMPISAAMNRVADTEASARQSADTVRKAASMVSLWTAFSLLFGAVVAVASAISARWMDDRITFSFAPRR